MGNIPQYGKYIAYARVPPDRLLSGLLTVNIRNSYDNSDNKDDTNQAYYDHWDRLSTGQKQSYPYGDTQPLTDVSDVVQDPGRGDKCQTFGDYDCFLFWVAGGMTLGSLTYGSSNSWEGPGGVDNGTLYASITDPRCNSYVRSHLIARSNNAHGHGRDASQNYLKSIGIKKEKALVDDVVATAADTSTYGDDGIHTEYIYNNTMYSSFHDPNDNKFSLENVGNNTFYTPVRDVSIYGSHRFAKTDFTNPTGYKNEVGTWYQVSYHDTTFWSLNVEVLLYGYIDGGGAGTGAVADKIRTDYNINVFYQPFGETPELDFSITEWST